MIPSKDAHRGGAEDELGGTMKMRVTCRLMMVVFRFA